MMLFLCRINGMKNILLVLMCSAILAAAALATPLPATEYGFLYWTHGWRGRSPADERLLCVQTGHYLAEFDVETVRLVRLGGIAEPAPYGRAVSEPTTVIETFTDVLLQLEVSLNGQRYHSVGTDRTSLKGLESPSRIIEAGRYLQRFDIQHLLFENEAGERLSGTGRLEVTAWPDRLYLLLEVSGTGESEAGEIRIALHSENGSISSAAPFKKADDNLSGSAFIAWSPKSGTDAPGFACDVTAAGPVPEGLPLEVTFDPKRGWFHVDLPEKQVDLAQHPEHEEQFSLRLVNQTDAPLCLPLLFSLEGAFTGITGLTPMLYDLRGAPTGLPVQISKNWHKKAEAPERYEGSWFHGAALVPLKPGESWEGSLRIAYAMWGGVPAVSHAQLCLIGWGVNQLWDQVAIGSWGETICYDPDINLNRSMIDDIRPLMVHGMGSTADKPVLWNWTNNVGGGDFLTWFDPAGIRQFPSRMRTAYLRYGPNLTEVRYAGTLGDGAIALQATVSSPGCDDVARAFHHVRYDVLKPAPFSRMALYQLGADQYNDHQFNTLARGGSEGLIEEWTFEKGGLAYDRAGIVCEGSGPWWFSLHDAVPRALRGGAWANRGLIVRAWEARLGGAIVERPYASFFGTNNGVPGMNVELTPPPELDVLLPGDYVDALVEIVVIPMKAEDYYGPNVNLRADLKQHANTWEPVHRLARLNTLNITMHKGTLLQGYPLRVQTNPVGEAAFSIQGGAGCVPCTLSGSVEVSHGRLRQTGEDFLTVKDSLESENQHRQIHYDHTSDAHEATFRLNLDTPEDTPQTRYYRFSME